MAIYASVSLPSTESCLNISVLSDIVGDAGPAIHRFGRRATSNHFQGRTTLFVELEPSNNNFRCGSSAFEEIDIEILRRWLLPLDHDNPVIVLSK